jgi:hypothetical protein
MSATLTALGSSLFSLCWQAATDLTYTIETSTDLRTWTRLPAVFRNQEGPLTLTLEGTDRLFARISHAADGDSNENGLPDHWEWSRFGRVDVDPLGDPDEDGDSTFEEWSAGTDPLDFYNGNVPDLHLSCGHTWHLQPGVVSPQAVSLFLFGPDGRPWPDAPVELRIKSQAPALLQPGDPPAAATAAITAYTDELGRICPTAHRIHCRFPESSGEKDAIVISAGGATITIGIVLHNGPAPSKPRDLRWEPGPDGTMILSWRGAPGEAERFIVEQLHPDTGWIERTNIDARDLPEPDPETGRYEITLPALP